MANTIKAYAKINLHLEILNKREDGYHNILGLFGSVNLFDLLKLEYIEIFDDTKNDIKIQIKSNEGLFNDFIESMPIEENLIYKATQLYFNGIGKSGEILYSLTKNIPVGGGLGGGSTDAAAALKLLNNLFCFKSREELFKLANRLGADVPYCMIGGMALCEGIGNIVEPLMGRLDFNILIINTGIHIDTKKAYQSLKRKNNNIYNGNEICNKKNMIKNSIFEGNLLSIKHILKNDFEKKVFDLYPELGKIKTSLENYGAEYSVMTGSGSSIIGLFSDREVAEAAYNKLKYNIKHIFLTNFIL